VSVRQYLISEHCQVNIPLGFSKYDPKVALYCVEPFNSWIEQGVVWFQTYPHDKKVTVHFDPDDHDEKVEQYRHYEGTVIRRPDAPPDPAFNETARSQAEIERWLLNWPPRIVFDLHRLVLAPDRREKNKAKAADEARKAAKRTSGTSGTARSRKAKRKASPTSTSTSPAVVLPKRARGAPTCSCKGPCATGACQCKREQVHCHDACHSALAALLTDPAQKHKNCKNHSSAPR
jgi:hypothetical protein